MILPQVARVEYRAEDATFLIQECSRNQSGDLGTGRISPSSLFILRLDYQAFKMMLFTATSKARLKVTETLKRRTIDFNLHDKPFCLSRLNWSY